MPMTGERWYYTNDYAREVFGVEDQALSDLVSAADEAGLPNLAVTPEIGKLLQLLTSLTAGRLAIEVGTLAGYSAICIARGLAPGGRLITIEFDDDHADLAESQIVAAGLADVIEVRRGPALEVLPRVAAEVGPSSVDLAFVDAEKREYPQYFELLRPLIAPNGLLTVDNIFGTGSSWIDDLSDGGSAATDEMNRTIAADDEFLTTGLNVRSGLLVAKRLASDVAPQ